MCQIYPELFCRRTESFLLWKNGTELLSGESVQDGESITVSPWNIKIVEEA